MSIKVLNFQNWIEETSKTYKTNNIIEVCTELKKRLKEIYDENAKKEVTS